MSGRRRLTLAALAIGATLAISCGGGPDMPPAPTATTYPVNPLLSMEITLDVPVGGAITAGQAQYFLPLLHEGRQVSPVAVYEGGFVLAETDLRPSGDTAQRFTLWDPLGGGRTALWEVPPGKQDIVTGITGSHLALVRTGMSLPFADWELHVRDLGRGEVRTIAASDARVASAPGVNPAPPFGFAPYPAVADGRLAWVGYTIVGDAVERQVHFHDLAIGSTRTVANARLAAMEDLGAATLGGDRVAWVRWLADGSARIEVHDSVSGLTDVLDLEAKPYALALDGNGDYLAWDDARGGKYVTALDGGNVRRFAGDEGWGLTVSGQRFSWAPAAAYGGTGGYYDLTTNQLRLVERRAGIQLNQALVLGDWFAWQALSSGENATADLAASGYYFLPLGGSP